MVKKVIYVYSPGMVVYAVECHVGAFGIVFVAEFAQGSADIVAHHVELRCEEHAVEAETETLARTVDAGQKFAYVYVVSCRYGKI